MRREDQTSRQRSVELGTEVTTRWGLSESLPRRGGAGTAEGLGLLGQRRPEGTTTHILLLLCWGRREGWRNNLDGLGLIKEKERKRQKDKNGTHCKIRSSGGGGVLASWCNCDTYTSGNLSCRLLLTITCPVWPALGFWNCIKLMWKSSSTGAALKEEQVGDAVGGRLQSQWLSSFSFLPWYQKVRSWHTALSRWLCTADVRYLPASAQIHNHIAITLMITGTCCCDNIPVYCILNPEVKFGSINSLKPLLYLINDENIILLHNNTKLSFPYVLLSLPLTNTSITEPITMSYNTYI